MYPDVPMFQHLWQAADEPDGAYTLVLMHGRGGCVQDFEQLKDIWQLSNLNYLLLQGPDPFFGGWSWYDLPPNPLPGIIRSRRLLGECIDSLDEQGFPRERCFLFGFSQGSLLTYEFGLRYPHSLAGYIGICGQLFDTWELIDQMHATPSRRGEWLWSAGIQDEHFAVATSRTQVQRLQEAGVSVNLVEWAKGHELDHEKELFFLKDWVKERMR